ncbi:FAD-dependent oxidoreductase [Rhodopirellula sp. JC740]|uniref:FAD-dependent oxidoreductase n=1 Tax=Rhodopirellula halodulae TaxID=2894198 RepID=A0ABS8NJY9_9BACT|nr:FAD-dependent oxidoreductase [Rhodopirellula sp. JC740]MCC9643836.1 FAD-dependent oxidoreductase [Rhodopirellula sp. JC740]
MASESKSKPVRLVIVGGVAGGASAATRARRMNEDAEIILFEKDEHVSFANCGLPYHIGGEIENRDALVVASAEFLRRRFRLDVRTREEVVSMNREKKTVTVRRHAIEGGSAEATYEQPYDKLILAPGASPIVPDLPIAPGLPSVDAANVQTLRNLADMDRIKALVDSTKVKRAVVVGAGYIGLEMVEQLRRRGVDVALVELQNQVLPLLDPEMAKPIESSLRENHVELHLGVGLESIQCEGTNATAVRLSDQSECAADLVIFGIGVRPNTQLAVESGLAIGGTGGVHVDQFSRTSDPDVYAVGDASEPIFGPTQSPMRVALAGPANRAGRLAGEHAVTGKSQPTVPVWGTSVVRVFDVSVAMTGLTRASARRFGVEATSVTVVAKHHAGYFPGAEAMALKLVFDPGDGKILGAQCVGGSGIDKRIDVIATAMHFGGSVRDLTGLDLAYAPPFGSAKDPVHMAGFAATNLLDGVETFANSDADLEGLQIVDVRSKAEIEKAPLRNADGVIHIPVDELRDRLDELDPTRPTVVSCAVGVRGHIASRILRQHGFNVQNLSGGATVRNRCFDAS